MSGSDYLYHDDLGRPVVTPVERNRHEGTEFEHIPSQDWACARCSVAPVERTQEQQDEYTPTTEEVRAAYNKPPYFADGPDAEFDRWLAAVVAAAKAEQAASDAKIARDVRRREVELHQVPFDELPDPNKYFVFGADRAAEYIERAAAVLRGEATK